MDLKKTAENINILADFCGVRDIEELRQNALKEKYGFEKADVLILFGGSIPAGCDTAAAGYLNGAARRLMIVGGEGHTTEFLRQNALKLRRTEEWKPTSWRNIFHKNMEFRIF